MARSKEVQAWFDHLTAARREIIRAVERAAEVDLRQGHAIEGARQSRAVRDAADDLLGLLGARGGE